MVSRRGAIVHELDRGTLEARLNRLLALAGRLPPGASEDHVRRCVCEVIEAEGPNRPFSVRTLITSIARLQQENRRGLRRALAAAATRLEGEQMTETTAAVATAVRDAEFEQARWDEWKARGRADDLAMRRTMRLVALAIATIAVVGTTFWIL